MTLLQAIEKLLGQAAAEPFQALFALLNQIETKYPDLTAEIEAVKGALNGAVTPEALQSLATSIAQELLQIAQGKISPADHPSDAA